MGTTSTARRGAHFTEGGRRVLMALGTGQEAALARRLVGVRSGAPLRRGVLWKMLRGFSPIAQMAAVLAKETGVAIELFFKAAQTRAPRRATGRHHTPTSVTRKRVRSSSVET